jgi:hypothetical protein
LYLTRWVGLVALDERLVDGFNIFACFIVAESKRSAMSWKAAPVGKQLWYAARDGDVAQLHRLIEGGADVNATDCYVSVYVGLCQL